jgi:uncharacterized protein
MDRILVPFREVKFAGSESSMEFEGYGAVFGNLDAYGDVIVKGAFAETLLQSKRTGIWPSMLSQHGGWGLTSEDLTPVGIWTDLSEDDVGLKSVGKLADTPRGRELHTLMKMEPRPAIDGLSIGFIIKSFTEIKLIEISPVTFPANKKARVASVKSLDAIMSLADAEAFLREAGGFSKAQALGIVSRIKAVSAIGRSESDDLEDMDLDPGDVAQLQTALKRLHKSIST